MTTEDFIRKVKKSVNIYDENADIILFGSRARGDNIKISDWDILILLDIEMNEEVKKQIRNELFEIELETEQVISTIIHSKDHWKLLSITPLYQNIENEGILF
jgi:uncharacterized protein